MTKFTIEQTDGDALDPAMVKGADDLPVNAPFLELKFIKENPLERVGVILEIDDDAREFLERELDYHMNPDAWNYRAVSGFDNGFGVQVSLGGIATFSDMEKQLFEVNILKQGSKKNEYDYWTDNPFTESDSGKRLNAIQVNELIEQVKNYVMP